MIFFSCLAWLKQTSNCFTDTPLGIKRTFVTTRRQKKWTLNPQQDVCKSRNSSMVIPITYIPFFTSLIKSPTLKFMFLPYTPLGKDCHVFFATLCLKVSSWCALLATRWQKKASPSLHNQWGGVLSFLCTSHLRLIENNFR